MSMRNDCAWNTSCYAPIALGHPDNSGRHARLLVAPCPRMADIPNPHQSIFPTCKHQPNSPRNWRGETWIWECWQGGRLRIESWLSWECNDVRQTVIGLQTGCKMAPQPEIPTHAFQMSSDCNNVRQTDSVYVWLLCRQVPTWGQLDRRGRYSQMHFRSVCLRNQLNIFIARESVWTVNTYLLHCWVRKDNAVLLTDREFWTPDRRRVTLICRSKPTVLFCWFQTVF